MKLLLSCLLLMILSCQSLPGDVAVEAIETNNIASFAGEITKVSAKSPEISYSKPVSPVAVIPTASVILAKKQVPVLCYHQIRDWKPTDSKTSRTYIVPPAAFAAQMRMLADSGYHTISPDQLYSCLLY